MASRTIERLPHELLIHCCSYLKGSIADIRNLRLASKCLYNASSLFLFDTLTIRITTKSISTLEAVSNHPIFRKSIKTIKLCLCFYGDVQDQLTRIGLISETVEESEQFERIQVRIGKIKHALSSLELEAIGAASAGLDFAAVRMITNAFDVYKARFVDQQVAIKDGTHLTRIGAALSKFRRPLSFEIFGYIGTSNEINPRSCSIATTMEWLDSDEACSDMALNSAEHLSFAVRWWTKQDLNFGVVISSEQHYQEMKHLASLTKAFFKTESTWTACKFSAEAGGIHSKFYVNWTTWRKYRADGLLVESMEAVPMRMIWYFASLKRLFANIFSK
ncbi:hypothetical protein EMCG_04404 [[Emmonsia] crescens]|uniref:F-box domain-containing protein n=1 Tax=[Emmonsia] crescens TaxID=73230 RepID=A0A0G2J7G8_9EURO|nr:hypothetical protein EMCG_04404 [Emmonsia crescens UAMH 3008]